MTRYKITLLTHTETMWWQFISLIYITKHLPYNAQVKGLEGTNWEHAQQNCEILVQVHRIYNAVVLIGRSKCITILVNMFIQDCKESDISLLDTYYTSLETE